MAKRDFYETLGVAKTATDTELKSAFRKAAMSCHPDRNPGDKQAEARFKELNEAYQHLSDPQKRAAYDRFGHAPSGKERGADLRYNLEITLEEAFRGKNASIKMPTSIVCETCQGSGAKPGSK